MNVLFVSMIPFESNSSATIQNKGIVKGLTDLGHSVDIMTLELKNDAFSYDGSMNDLYDLVRNSYYIPPHPQYAMLMAKKPHPKNGNYHRASLNSIMRKAKTNIRNLIKIAYRKLVIFDAQKKNVNQVMKLQIDYHIYDVIISSSDPKSSHLIVKKIYMSNPTINARWIQYWGDPMFHDITRERGIRDFFVKYQEKKIIKMAHKIIYASPLTLKQQKETYPAQAIKMDYANQVFLKRTDSNDEVIKSNENANTNIVVGYYGSYDSTIRNINPLYEAALDSNYKLIICGPSNIKLNSMKNIRILEKVPYKEVSKMEEESDILITICNSKGTQIPGKIYYCAGYNKPIIIVLDGEFKEELKKYFESFGRYILCNNNPESINKAIEEAKSELNKTKGISQELFPKYMALRILK